MKLLLEDPRNVRDLLAIQGLDVIKLIDFDRAKLVRTTYVQRDYRHLGRTWSCERRSFSRASANRHGRSRSTS